MSGTHRRNTGPMRESPRCGARTRRGMACEAPAVSGKRRCRMHGGAKGSGAPEGNRNALKHGDYTKEAIADRKALRELIRASTALLEEIEDESAAQADAGPVLRCSDELDAGAFKCRPDLLQRAGVSRRNAFKLLKPLYCPHSHIGSTCKFIRRPPQGMPCRSDLECSDH